MEKPKQTKPKLEKTNCDLCGSGEKMLLYDKSPFLIVRCAECGLVYVSPRLSVRALKEEVYDEAYFDAERGYGLAGHFDEGRREAARRAREILAWVERSAKRGRLLDVGCAGGFFLDAARRRGWEVRGVEFATSAAALAREAFGLDVFEGEITDAPFEEASFDVVTLLDVIEHLTSPAAGLKKARALLRPGGKLFVITPNFDSLSRRSHGKNWGLLEPEHHLYYFTPKTIDRMTAGAGFKVERIFFRELGIAELLLSAATLGKVGFKVDAESKRNLRERLGGIRDSVGNVVRFADRNLLKPLFPKIEGTAIYLEAIAE
ncbi:MAG: class I SAM-dependent methyltransferase [bacterium]